MKKFEKIFNIIALVIMIPTVLLIGIMAIAEATGNRFTARPKVEEARNAVLDENLPTAEKQPSTDNNDVDFQTEEEALELFKAQAQQVLKDSIEIENAQSQVDTPSSMETIPNAQNESNSDSNSYILNTESLKFHFSSCRTIDGHTGDHLQSFTGTASEAIDMGYDACGVCHPH